MAPNTVSIRERGEREPSGDLARDDTIITLASYFDVPFAYLLGVSDKREWSVLSDEEAAEAAESEEKEHERHMVMLHRDLKPGRQHGA